MSGVAPALSCVVVVPVPDRDGMADVRQASMTTVPNGARVRLDCGPATWFDRGSVPLLADTLRCASAVQIEARTDVVLELRTALAAAWDQIPAAESRTVSSAWDGGDAA